MLKPHDADLGRDIEQEVAREIHKIDQIIQTAQKSEDAASAAPALLDAPMDRRSLLKGGTAAVSSAAIAGTLQLFMARRAEAAGGFGGPTAPVPCPYGDPVPTKDEVTGLPLIGLPPGFRYWSHGWTGDRILPHIPNPLTPALHDGMGVLAQVGSLVVMCRNHEVSVAPSFLAGRMQYSPNGGGGNTNMMFDTRQKKWLSVWPTLSGTVRNCAGGITPQGTWLSCEETNDVTLADPANPASESFTHGWVFEVPTILPSNGKPIKEMGRRSHEAAAVDPRTGYVYLTEDTTPGGVYRFVPDHRFHYHQGGRLEVLKIVGKPNLNLRGTFPPGGAAYPAALGAPLDVEWVSIDDPENLGGVSNYAQGALKGAADFRRPEGAWYADGTIFFVSTDGGQSGNGQVFALNLKKQQLTLIYDAPSANELDNPDNVVVTPRGGLMFCEDNSGNPAFLLDGVSTERLVALTKDGQDLHLRHEPGGLQRKPAHLDAGLHPPEQRHGLQSELAGPGVGRCHVRRIGRVAVRQHPDAGDHLRDHRALARRPPVAVKHTPARRGLWRRTRRSPRCISQSTDRWRPRRRPPRASILRSRLLLETAGGRTVQAHVDDLLAPVFVRELERGDEAPLPLQDPDFEGVEDKVVQVLEKDHERPALWVVTEAEEPGGVGFELITDSRRYQLDRRRLWHVVTQVIPGESLEVLLPLVARDLLRRSHLFPLCKPQYAGQNPAALSGCYPNPGGNADRDPGTDAGIAWAEALSAG